MSINDATPADWDKTTFKRNRMGEPTFDEYMKRLNSSWVFDNTSAVDSRATEDAVQFKDCWDEAEIDDVNNPSHYNYGKVECIEAIEESMTPEAFKGYLKGNAIKYLWRYERKSNALQDLQKATWYLNRLTQINLFDDE